MTNAMEDDDEKQPVHDLVDALEERLYDYNTEGHRPSFVKVEYGDITFYGQLKTLETEYTLFDPDGIPLRAELKVTLTGYCSQKEEKSWLLQPEGGEIALLQTLARRVTVGHAERGADACRPLLRDIR